MAKKIDFKEKNVEELTKLLAQKREELRTLRFSSVSRSVKDTTEARRLRADVARIMTELGVRSKKPATVE